jgi:hypothetical protein
VKLLRAARAGGQDLVDRFQRTVANHLHDRAASDADCRILDVRVRPRSRKTEVRMRHNVSRRQTVSPLPLCLGPRPGLCWRHARAC